MADQILFVRPTRCLRCGAVHTTSELFAVDINNLHGRHLMPAREFRCDLEFEKILMDARTTPICHACADSVQPTTDRESYARWQETLKRKREEARRETLAARTVRVKAEPTLDDLI